MESTLTYGAARQGTGTGQIRLKGAPRVSTAMRVKADEVEWGRLFLVMPVKHRILIVGFAQKEGTSMAKDRKYATGTLLEFIHNCQIVISKVFNRSRSCCEGGEHPNATLSLRF